MMSLESPLAIERRAAISEDGCFRWWLVRKWGRGSTVCWIMLNPSTADAKKDDPTLHRILAFSRFWGCGELIVVNLYPFRTSKPEECRRWSAGAEDGGTRDILQQNASLVGEVARRAEFTMLAWGSASWAWNWSQDILRHHLEGGELPLPKLFCLGLNANRTPKHPLARGRHRVAAEQQPIPYGRSPREETP